MAMLPSAQVEAAPRFSVVPFSVFWPTPVKSTPPSASIIPELLVVPPDQVKSPEIVRVSVPLRVPLLMVSVLIVAATFSVGVPVAMTTSSEAPGTVLGFQLLASFHEVPSPPPSQVICAMTGAGSRTNPARRREPSSFTIWFIVYAPYRSGGMDLARSAANLIRGRDVKITHLTDRKTHTPDTYIGEKDGTLVV